LSKISKNRLMILFIFIFNMLLCEESLAIVTKSIGSVEYKKYSEEINKAILNLGSELFNDDLIKTMSNGFVKFSYLDDGTTIKIHKNSELYVRGNINDVLIDKRLSISKGVYNFDISKQDSDEFTIITPTSVASVKGTRFILSAGSDGTDEFYGFEGIVEVLNKESNTTLRLTRNIKVTSLSTGEISSEIMTQSDFNITNDIEQVEEQYDSEEIIPEPEEEIDDGSGLNDEDEVITPSDEDSEQTTNEIRIRVTNSAGEEKEIIIRYYE